MAAGSISEEQFDSSLQSFLQQCLLSHDTWEAKIAVNGQKYLCKRQNFPGQEEPLDGTTSGLLQEELQIDSVLADEGTVDIPSVGAVYTYEYHVVFSQSYGVPVLYFNAYKPDGKLLSLDEIWSNIPQIYQERLKHERWTFLTQQEHPLLGRPFYQLHPCQTAELMKQTQTMRENTEEYILTWLSTVGPVVGLDIPISYASGIAGKDLT